MAHQCTCWDIEGRRARQDMKTIWLSWLWSIAFGTWSSNVPLFDNCCQAKYSILKTKLTSVFLLLPRSRTCSSPPWTTSKTKIKEVEIVVLPSLSTKQAQPTPRCGASHHTQTPPLCNKKKKENRPPQSGDRIHGLSVVARSSFTKRKQKERKT